MDKEQEGTSQTSPAGNGNEKASEDDDYDNNYMLRVEQRNKE